MTTVSVSIAHAKNNLPQLIHDVEAGLTVHVTRHGRAAAVLISAEMFAALEEQRQGFAAGMQRFLHRHQGHLLTPQESSLLEPERRLHKGRRVVL